MVAERVVPFRPRKVSARELDVAMHASEERTQAAHLKSLLRRLHLHWRAEDEVGFYRTLKEAEFVTHRWERRWSDGDVA
jgi:hypothetical protein